MWNRFCKLNTKTNYKCHNLPHRYPYISYRFLITNIHHPYTQYIQQKLRTVRNYHYILYIHFQPNTRQNYKIKNYNQEPKKKDHYYIRYNFLQYIFHNQAHTLKNNQNNLYLNINLLRMYHLRKEKKKFYVRKIYFY